MKTVEVLFWICLFLVFYAYVGYGILLYVLVRFKELFGGRTKYELSADLPSVTLLIAAYNEEDVVDEKMVNSLALNYPADRLSIVWITDGSTDATNEMLAKYPTARVLYEPARGGKSAAFNRAMPFIDTPLTVYSDANTMLCEDAVMEIVRAFADPQVGCVSGEKRVEVDGSQGATAGEGIYWKYESLLKSLDDRLYSAVGAAGELFAIRTQLYEYLPNDTLLDDFVLSIRIVQKGYRIAYCKDAYALEKPSADMSQEEKRKVRIAAGGLQSTWRLLSVLNIFRYGIFTLQYVSHKTLRWTLAPLSLFAMLPLNVVLVAGSTALIYKIMLVGQLAFYALALKGYSLKGKTIDNKLVYIPYYFVFMNHCSIRGARYLCRHKGSGAWEKAKRSA